MSSPRAAGSGGVGRPGNDRQVFGVVCPGSWTASEEQRQRRQDRCRAPASPSCGPGHSVPPALRGAKPYRPEQGAAGLRGRCEGARCCGWCAAGRCLNVVTVRWTHSVMQMAVAKVT